MPNPLHLHTPEFDLFFSSRLKSGEEEAWRELLNLTRERIAFYIRKFDRHPQNVEDLTQEVFLRAWKGIHTFRDGEPLMPWLYTIARNTVTEIKRRKHHQQFSMDEAHETWGMDAVHPGESHSQKMERLHTRDEVQNALTHLTPQRREAVLLRFVDELPYEDIARIQGVNVNTAKSRIFRAKELLRTLLHQELK